MTEAQTALARRAVACRGWRWLPGMLAVATEGMVALPLRLTDDHDWPHDLGLRLPDLTDPATLGCLLALVREAWGDLGIFVRPRGSKMRPDWAVFTGEHSDIIAVGADEAEALVAALESSPCR